MSVVSTLVEQVADTAKAIRVLQKAGAIDLRKPGQVIEASKNAKTLGPPAAIVTHAVKEYPDDPAVADLHGTVTFGELAAHSKALATRSSTRG